MSDYQPSKIIPGTIYQVVRLIGQGGMGTVYEVDDTTVGKRYVLKTLHAHLRDRKEIAARIGKEARILAQLSHPNIVEVVTAGVTGDSLRLPYFVMQKLNGHTLRAVIGAKGRLPTETAYSIAIDLLDALDHAHAIGVIHRDVKPENIFLHRGPSDAHQTKLLDFGVMRMLSGEKHETRFVGTLRYAPPEQLQGGEITPRTDLYAAGLVLYEMLVGAGPFDEHTTDRDIAAAHLELAPPPISSRIGVSPKLEALVMSALSKDPEKRPRDAFSFAAKLRELSLLAMSARSSSPYGVQAGASEPLLRGMSGPPYSPTPPSGPRPLRPEPTEPDRDAATTTEAISSHATALPMQRRAGAVAAGVVGVAIVVAGLALGVRWRRGHTAVSALTSASTPPSTSTSTSTPTPTLTFIPIATPTPTTASASIPTTASTPIPSPSSTPDSIPAPEPRARPPRRSSPRPDDSGTLRLPGPGF